MTELFVGSLTAADAERIRALILPDQLPRTARTMRAGVEENGLLDLRPPFESEEEQNAEG